MTITPPPLIDVHPGDPITSEGWNNIVLAIKALYDHANAGLGSLAVNVTSKPGGNPVPSAVVTAIPRVLATSGPDLHPTAPAGPPPKRVSGDVAVSQEPGVAVRNPMGPVVPPRLGIQDVVRAAPAVGPGVSGAGTPAAATPTVAPGLPPDAPAPPRSGLYAGATIRRFFIPQLLPGSYDVVVEAPGFSPEKRQVTMGTHDLEVEVELTATDVGSPVPNLFGSILAEAVAMVTGAGFHLTRIVDSHGRDVSAEAASEEMKMQPVIAQTPEAGTRLAVNGAIQIAVSAPAEYAVQVKVPDIRGMTIDEARATLAAAGLVLGDTSTVGS